MMSVLLILVLYGIPAGMLVFCWIWLQDLPNGKRKFLYGAGAVIFTLICADAVIPEPRGWFKIGFAKDLKMFGVLYISLIAFMIYAIIQDAIFGKD